MSNEVSPQSAPLRIEPSNVDFGLLKPGEGGSVVLKVSGGLGDVLLNCDQLEVMPSSFGHEDAEIRVTLLASPGGELIWHNIVLKGRSDEVAVLVTARWEGLLVPEAAPSKPPALAPAATANETSTLSGTQISPSVRPWTGRRCARCHKNFAYDANVHDWEQCRCNWYQIAINLSLRIINELRYGIKDFPSFAKETWNVILGKEKW